MASCIIMMAISHILKIEMWIIVLVAIISLTLWVIGYTIKKGVGLQALKQSYLKAPWGFIPMILSMFVLVQGMSQSGAVSSIAESWAHVNPIWGYGISSHVVANMMNNQPMAMLYAEMISISQAPIGAVYAAVIGSNTAVLLTPFGALAGLMWLELLDQFGYKMSFFSYIKQIAIIGGAVLIVTLLTLTLVL